MRPRVAVPAARRGSAATASPAGAARSSRGCSPRPGGRVVVHAWQPAADRVVLRAGAADPESPAPRESLELAIERMRFALGVDDDLTEFARTFRGDPLIGEIIHHRPWLRPRRRPWPWEALAWAVTEQLIEAAERRRDPAPRRAPLGRN